MSIKAIIKISAVILCVSCAPISQTDYVLKQGNRNESISLQTPVPRNWAYKTLAKYNFSFPLPETGTISEFISLDKEACFSVASHLLGDFPHDDYFRINFCEEDESIESYLNKLCIKGPDFNPELDPFKGEWEEGYWTVFEKNIDDIRIMKIAPKCWNIHQYLISHNGRTFTGILSGDEQFEGIKNAEISLLNIHQ